MIGGRVGPRASLDMVGKKKSLIPTMNQAPAIQTIAYHYTDRAILAHGLFSFTVLMPEKNIHSP
jgi:hypothetical protein